MCMACFERPVSMQVKGPDKYRTRPCPRNGSGPGQRLYTAAFQYARSSVLPTNGIAQKTVKFLTDMGLFIGQSAEFFRELHSLAKAADAAQRGL